jgi:hypothetical protein
VDDGARTTVQAMLAGAATLSPVERGRVLDFLRSCAELVFLPENLVEELTEPEPAASRETGFTPRVCLAVDITTFASHGRDAALRLRQSVAEVTSQALRRARIDEEMVITHSTGDGQLLILPAGIQAPVAVPRLIEGLRDALDRVNRKQPVGERLVLRVAMSAGPISTPENGLVGFTVVAARRVLDSEQLHRALHGDPRPHLAFAVDATIYDALVQSSSTEIDPHSLQPATISAPTKGFLQRFWLYVPDPAPSANTTSPMT